MLTSPRVFISYSHDSPQHRDRVLQLSNQLRQDGIDCHLDQYEQSPPEGWPRWMLNQIDAADFVLVVCTDTYHRRFRGHAPTGTGKGAKWEGAVVTQALYDAEARNTRFIPLVLTTADSATIPVVLRGATYYDLSRADGYDTLYRRLTNQPRVVKPDLGDLRLLDDPTTLVATAAVAGRTGNTAADTTSPWSRLMTRLRSKARGNQQAEAAFTNPSDPHGVKQAIQATCWASDPEILALAQQVAAQLPQQQVVQVAKMIQNFQHVERLDQTFNL